MTDLRQAAQQALEALESASGNINPERGYVDELENEVTAATKALRTALEQPEQEPVSVTYREVADTMNMLWGGNLKAIAVAMEMEKMKLYTSPPAAQPEQEPVESPYNPNPVEYQYHYPDGSWRCSNGDVINGMRPDRARSLYALKDNT
jgi:hypothetical protein